LALSLSFSNQGLLQEAIPHQFEVDIGDLPEQGQRLLVLAQTLAYQCHLLLGDIDLALPSIAMDDDIPARTVLFALMAGTTFSGAGTEALQV
jgi:hypothetical protein